jgi:hypothetical protein
MSVAFLHSQISFGSPFIQLVGAATGALTWYEWRAMFWQRGERERAAAAPVVAGLVVAVAMAIVHLPLAGTVGAAGLGRLALAIFAPACAVLVMTATAEAILDDLVVDDHRFEPLLIPGYEPEVEL